MPLVNSTDLVVSVGCLFDDAGAPPSPTPGYDGTDDSVYANTPYLNGIVPLMSETEWLAAWSAWVEFLVLFKARFFSAGGLISGLLWVDPDDLNSEDRSSAAKLRVPSLRQLSQFLLNPAAFPAEPPTAGFKIKALETSAAALVSSAALVPWTSRLNVKFAFPESETLVPPEAVGDLLDRTQGSFGACGNPPAHSLGLLPYDPGNSAGVKVSAERSRFVPDLGAARLFSLLGLGAFPDDIAIVTAGWTPSGVPSVFGELDFASSDDSVLRLAFGGTAPDDAVYLELIRNGFLKTPSGSAELPHPFRSTPVSLLLFWKSLCRYVATGTSSHYLLASAVTVRLPVVSYTDSGLSVVKNRTGGGAISWTSTPCSGTPSSGGDSIPGYYGNESSSTESGHLCESVADAFGGVTRGSVTGSSADFGGAQYSLFASRRRYSIDGDHSSSGSLDDYAECSGATPLIYHSEFAETSAIHDLRKESAASATLPAASWPGDLTPWSTTVFDWLKTALGEDEASYLAAKGMISKVAVYISISVSGIGSGPSGVSTTVTDSTTKTPGGDFVYSTTVDRTGETTAPSPAEAAAAFLDGALSAVLPGVSPIISDVVARCTDSGSPFDLPSSGSIDNIDNSLSVWKTDLFAHQTVLVWEGTDLSHPLTEADVYAAVMAAVDVSGALTILAGLAPSRYTITTERNIVESSYRDSRSPDYVRGAYAITASNLSWTEESVELEERRSAALILNAGPMFARVDYNFTHYR